MIQTFLTLFPPLPGKMSPYRGRLSQGPRLKPARQRLCWKQPVACNASFNSVTITKHLQGAKYYPRCWEPSDEQNSQMSVPWSSEGRNNKQKVHHDQGCWKLRRELQHEGGWGVQERLVKGLAPGLQRLGFGGSKHLHLNAFKPLKMSLPSYPEI